MPNDALFGKKLKHDGQKNYEDDRWQHLTRNRFHDAKTKCKVHSRRRHDPDQVQGSTCVLSAALSGSPDDASINSLPDECQRQRGCLPRTMFPVIPGTALCVFHDNVFDCLTDIFE